MPKRIFNREIYKKNFGKQILNLILKIFLSISFFFIFFIIICFIYYAKELPRPEKFTEKQFTQTTKIYDRTGENLLYELYGEEKRTIVPIDIVPEHLKKAIIVAEDKNFYKHYGIDFKGILRAIYYNLKFKKATQGGSTITQQLIRSTFLTTTKTIERKIREIVLTIEIERKYSKNQILEWYINQVPFGSNTYGVESASQTYFNKSVSEISLEESAVLAALIKAPSYLSPYGKNKTQLLDRKDYILNRMLNYGYISEQELFEAKNKEIIFAPNIIKIKAPHFTLYVKKYLEEKYDKNFLKEKGLKIYTSLDWDLQQLAEKSVRDGVNKNEIYNAFNAALIAINPNTGEVLAMKGCKDYFAKPKPEGCVSGKNCLFEPKVNIAVFGKGRQPGSAFKPFAYITAFNKGYNDKTIIIDEETNFGLWGGKEYIPQNYNNKFYGPITLRNALAQSINVASVKVLMDLAGLKDTIKTAEKLGITTLKPPFGPSIVLGGWEVKLLDMTSAYGVFASQGLKTSPVFILKITDSDGNIIYENKKTPKRVLGVNETNLLNDILSDNKARSPMFGSNSALYINNKIAVKTGTTQEYKDAWTIGYSSSLVCGVWVGNNDSSPMAKKPSAVLSSPIWKAFMEKALKL